MSRRRVGSRRLQWAERVRAATDWEMRALESISKIADAYHEWLSSEEFPSAVETPFGAAVGS